MVHCGMIEIKKPRSLIYLARSSDMQKYPEIVPIHIQHVFFARSICALVRCRNRTERASTPQTSRGDLNERVL